MLAIPCSLCVTRHDTRWGAYDHWGDGSFRLAVPWMFGGIRRRRIALLAHGWGAQVLLVRRTAGRERRARDRAALPAGDPGAVEGDPAAPPAGVARGWRSRRGHGRQPAGPAHQHLLRQLVPCGPLECG